MKMAPNLLYHLRQHLGPSGHGLGRVLLLHGVCFVALVVLQTLLVVAGQEGTYIALRQQLSLPGAWAAFVAQPWALLTHMWVHTTFLGAVGGLLALHALGRQVQHHLGSHHLVQLHVLGGVAGGATLLLLTQLSPHLQAQATPVAGFAGSLYAPLAAASTLAPRQPVGLFFFTVPLRWLAAGAVISALLGLAGPLPSPNATYLGGALLGHLYARYHRAQPGTPTGRRRWHWRRATLVVTQR